MTITKTLLSVTAAAFLATGCTVGGDFDPNNPDPTDPNNPTDPTNPVDPGPPASYSIAVTTAPTAQLTLGNEADFAVSITPENGFTGPVTFSATGAPASWQVSFEPAVVNIVDGVVGTTNLRVVVPSDAEALTAQIALQANAAPGLRQGAVSVEVENRFILDIPDGTGDGAHTAFANVPPVRLGATIAIQNSDSVAHRIHAGDRDVGFPHQPNAMGTGEAYVVNITATGSFEFYCHEHERAAGEGALIIVDPAAQ